VVQWSLPFAGVTILDLYGGRIHDTKQLIIGGWLLEDKFTTVCIQHDIQRSLVKSSSARSRIACVKGSREVKWIFNAPLILI
jgi:hypothetical protein